MWLEIKQLTRLQIIRYCEKLEKENKTNAWLVKYWKAQYEEKKKEIKSRDELIRYYKKKVKDLKTEIGKLVKWE
jgi:phage host-nuclease inhibitor protein Gam